MAVMASMFVLFSVIRLLVVVLCWLNLVTIANHEKQVHVERVNVLKNKIKVLKIMKLKVGRVGSSKYSR